jgi:glycosyltransferase involved in cell wall biosynthesis
MTQVERRESTRPWAQSELTDLAVGAEAQTFAGVDLSVVIPLYDEEESIDLAVREVLDVLDHLPLTSELILVNDGSSDSTGAKALAWHDVDHRVKVIEFRRNFGQTAGISAGFDYAAGRVVVVMDGDQQNDPADIPVLLAALDDGYDVASGWRADRKDKFISRRLPSTVANWLISRVTGVQLHDYGCSLKAYDKEVIEHLELFGELHRFIPALAVISGAKVIEIPVNHRARELGSSKYGISRMPRVILDLLTVKFLIGYRQKPMQFFGRLALVCLGAASLSALWSGSRLLRKIPLRSGVSTIFGVAALQFASFGLIGELLTRVYFKDSTHRPYVVRSATGENPNVVTMVPDVPHHSPVIQAEGSA